MPSSLDRHRDNIFQDIVIDEVLIGCGIKPVTRLPPMMNKEKNMICSLADFIYSMGEVVPHLASSKTNQREIACFYRYLYIEAVYSTKSRQASHSLLDPAFATYRVSTLANTDT